MESDCVHSPVTKHHWGWGSFASPKPLVPCQHTRCRDVQLLCWGGFEKLFWSNYFLEVMNGDDIFGLQLDCSLRNFGGDLTQHLACTRKARVPQYQMGNVSEAF